MPLFTDCLEGRSYRKPGSQPVRWAHGRDTMGLRSLSSIGPGLRRVESAEEYSNQGVTSCHNEGKGLAKRNSE